MSLKDKIKKIRLLWFIVTSALGFGILYTAYPTKTKAVVVDMKLPQPNPRYCFVGDTGEGNEGQYKVAAAMAQDCDAIFITGDLVYDDGIQGLDDPELKEKFIEPYWKLQKPFYLSLGNHDYYGRKPGAWIDVARRYEWVNFPHFYYVARNGTDCFVALDTTPIETGWDSDRTAEQSEWLRGLDLSGCKRKYAFGHHPYKSSGPHGDAKGDIKEFLEKHIIGKFDGYIAGHDHHLERAGNESGTELILSGAGCKLRKCKRGKRDRCVNKLGFFVLQGGAFNMVTVE